MTGGAIGAEERRERNSLDVGDADADVYLGDACYHENPYCRPGVDVSETVPRWKAQRQYAACFNCVLKDYGRDDLGSPANLVDLDDDGPTPRGKRRRDCPDQDSDSGAESNGSADAIDQDDVDFYRARALHDASDATIRSCLRCLGPTPQAKRRRDDASDVWECLKCGREENIR